MRATIVAIAVAILTAGGRAATTLPRAVPGLASLTTVSNRPPPVCVLSITWA
jgi:hypothetical protein